MIGHDCVIRGRVELNQTPPSVFITLLPRDQYENESSRRSGRMTDAVYAKSNWIPDVLVCEDEFLSKTDFGFVHGLTVQANLGENYLRGFKFAQAIAERQPKQIIAIVGTSEDPLLFWNAEKGFYE